MTMVGTKLEEKMLQIFEHLHTHPEVSWKEEETTKYIINLLKSEGVSVYTFDDCTGLVAEIGSGKPTIGVRADIDALWQEVDGQYQANHSCGHDAHMTMVIGTILSLKDKITNGTVRFIFQPAEETGSGALKMVEKGIADDLDYLFGVHLRPVEELPNGKASPSIRHGAAAFLVGKVEGSDAHGARPHQGINAIDVLMTLNAQLKTITLSPFEVYSIKMTKLQAGGKSLNIIPGTAEFALDVRAQKNEVLEQLQQLVEEKIQKVKSLYDVELKAKWLDFTPGAEVSSEAEQFLREGIVQALGKEALADPVITSGSDDFHFYTIKRPKLKASMLGLGADLKPGLHHPKMTFDTNRLKDGTSVIAASILNVLNQEID
ncbi:MAG TPA: M20 peptidase aminoacylase family protein [Chondromyces sp.]|nr:M20 peptidase aminoacylase family protein [Chondromyces sp.]